MDKEVIQVGLDIEEDQQNNIWLTLRSFNYFEDNYLVNFFTIHSMLYLKLLQHASIY